MAVSSVQLLVHRLASCPVRKFIEFSLERRLFGLVSEWLLTKEGWTPHNISRIGFDVAPLPDSDQGLDPVYYRMMLEAVRVRDLELFGLTPSIKTLRCDHFHFDLTKYLSDELLLDPNNETLFQMLELYFKKNPDFLHHVHFLLEKAVSKRHLDLVKKIIGTFNVHMQARRDLLHYPFDHSIGSRDNELRRICRELLIVLDPDFGIPSWLKE